jgi:hypothetical protein
MSYDAGCNPIIGEAQELAVDTSANRTRCNHYDLVGGIYYAKNHAI